MNPLSFPNCCSTSINCFGWKKKKKHYLLSLSIQKPGYSGLCPLPCIPHQISPPALPLDMIISYNLSPQSQSRSSLLHMRSLLIIQWLSKCGSLSSSTSITNLWEMQILGLPLTYQIRNSTVGSSNMCLLSWSLRTTALVCSSLNIRHPLNSHLAKNQIWLFILCLEAICDIFDQKVKSKFLSTAQEAHQDLVLGYQFSEGKAQQIISVRMHCRVVGLRGWAVESYCLSFQSPPQHFTTSCDFGWVP